MGAIAKTYHESWLNVKLQEHESPVYIELLRMSPIDLEVTYKPRASELHKDKEEESEVVRRLRGVGLVIPYFERAPFRLNGTEISNIYGTSSEVSSVVWDHYKHRLVKNAFSLLFSSNALGNMNLMAIDIGTGAKDFWHKPREGFVDGPLEGGKGIFIGTLSLFGNTGKGIVGATSRVLNSFSKSLLILAHDQDYLDSREKGAQEYQPGNIITGMAAGLKSTATGVVSGVTGIVA